MNLDGYVPVTERLRLAHTKYPDLRIVELPHNVEQFGAEQVLICRVLIYRDASDPIPTTGSVCEPLPGRTPFTRGSELMVGYTSATGRALGYMGFGLDSGMASRDEIAAATARPVTTTGLGPPPVKPGPAEVRAWLDEMPDEPEPPPPPEHDDDGPRVWGENRPTVKMLGFARKLASAAGIEVPADALDRFDACRMFIEAHK